MPNIKSAKKRVLVGERNRVRKVAIRSEYRSAVKAAQVAIEAGDEKLAQEKIHSVKKLVDKAIQRKAIHANKGARVTSRLAKLFVAKFKTK